MQRRKLGTNCNKKYHIEEPWITYKAILKFHISNLTYHKQAFLSELVLSPNLPLLHKEKMSWFYQKVQALIRGSHYFRFVYTYTNLCLGPQP